MALPDGRPMEVTPLDADIIWLFDLSSGAGIYPYDVANCSILVDGPLLYVNTSNGVKASGRVFTVGAADAPALVVIEKATGRLVARDHENMSPRTPHATWASPALGEVNGRRLIFLGGSDGVCSPRIAFTWGPGATSAGARRQRGSSASTPQRPAILP